MKFEFKRIIYSRDIEKFILSSFLFLILTLVNTYLVQPYFACEHRITLDYYNAVTQCMAFIFAPIAGVYFAKDFENNAIVFYRNYKINIYRYFGRRIMAYFIFGSIILSLFTIIFLIIFQVPLKVVFKITVFLVLDYLYFLLICSVLAVKIKKKTETVFATMGSAVIMSMVNISPIPVFKGRLYLLDGNSELTATVKKLIENGDENIMQVLVHQFTWILILIAILICIMHHEVKNEESSYCARQDWLRSNG